MSQLKLGKRPATHDRRDLRFGAYLDTTAVPAPPAQFGHEALYPPKGWGMLGNDEWGDCAWAGAAHETMVFTKETHPRKPAVFTTAGVVGDYEALTGFKPSAGPPDHNPTDLGTSIREQMAYRRKTGIKDSAGARHRIGAYLSIDYTDLDQVYQAMYLFQVVGIGFNFPLSAFDQFHAGKPWDVVPGATVKGAHYVCAVAKRKNIEVVTWGSLQQMTERFFNKYVDEAWAYISVEALKDGKSPQGFRLADLKLDLAALESI
ncbi:MAG TPA: hypothetical protein VGM80_11430 [Gaiellaceae bacterium]|jgi:hypothetical protein